MWFTKTHNFAPMLKHLLVTLSLFVFVPFSAFGTGLTLSKSLEIDLKDVDYCKADSMEICRWLVEAATVPAEESPVIWFGKKFLGRPYVAHTLEKHKRERLIVNTRELDCTTFTENVMALELCRRNGKTSFGDFCQYLRNIRYEKDMDIDYVYRNHYFTGWANSNIARGYFAEIAKPDNLFSATQNVFVDYMSKHADSYKMIRETPNYLPGIRAMEKRLSGGRYKYIPKSAFVNTNTPEFRAAIQEGDIVIILTDILGLDTQHITLAHWHSNDGQLHIMHASSLHKKVVFEPLTLYKYLQRQKKSRGVRVLRLNY